MYVAVVTILLGWSTLWAARMLRGGAVLLLIGLHVRVRRVEEPWAARQ